MAATNYEDLLALDVSSRLELIAKLWDSIVKEGQSLPVPEEEREILAQRLKEDDEERPD